MQHLVDTTDVSLIGIWDPADGQGAQMPGLDDSMEELTMLGYLLRGLGLILMGAGLYRLGFVNGAMPARV